MPNSKQTSAKVASKASKILSDGRYSKTSKSVAVVHYLKLRKNKYLPTEQSIASFALLLKIFQLQSNTPTNINEFICTHFPI